MSAARRRSRKHRSRGPQTTVSPPEASSPLSHGKRWRTVALVALAVLAFGVAIYASLGPVARYQTRRHFTRAQEQLASAREDAAAMELNTVLQRDPRHRDARRLLAQLELRRGRIEPAFLHLQSYTDMFPEDADGWTALAELRNKAGQLEEAEAALTHAIEWNPQRASLRAQRAGFRFRIGRHHGALIDAELAVQRDARDVEAWIVLCREVSRFRGREAAADAVRKAVAAAGSDPRLLAILREPSPAAEEDPRSPAARPRSTRQAESWPGQLASTIREFLAEIRNRSWSSARRVGHTARQSYPGTMLGPWLEGIAALSEGDLQIAEERFLEALEVSPRSHRAITNLVALWSKRYGAASAGDRLVRTADRDPGFTYPLPIAAQAYLEAAQPAQAEATVRRMFSALPASPLPYRELARFFLLVDRGSEAVSTCADGLARFPGDAELHLLQARGFLVLGDRKAAIRAYEEAVSARPDDQIAAAQLAHILVVAREDESSRARALELVRKLEFDHPSDPEVLTAMGVTALKTGNDPRRARQWLLAAKDLAPEEPSLRFHLALAYSRSGEIGLARQELGEALKSGRTFDEEPEARRLAQAIGLTDPVTR
jgi:tetratricopeptide (TPR) repeat protein